MEKLETLEANLKLFKKLAIGKKGDDLERLQGFIKLYEREIINHPDYLDIYTERKRKTLKKTIVKGGKRTVKLSKRIWKKLKLIGSKINDTLLSNPK